MKRKSAPTPPAYDVASVFVSLPDARALAAADALCVFAADEVDPRLHAAGYVTPMVRRSPADTELWRLSSTGQAALLLARLAFHEGAK